MRKLWPLLVLVTMAAAAACGGPTPVVPDAPAAAAAAPVPAADAPFQCPETDTRPTIVLRGCDTGVANAALGDCTLADHLRACESGPVEDFPRCVAKTTERWIETGVIQGRDKGLIQACAADDREVDGGPRPE